MANGLQVDFLLAGVMGTNNKPLAYGKVECYGSGGSGLQPVYTDATLTTEATNPVILDARGSANVYASGSYKFVIKDKNDVTIDTFDNLYYVVPETEATDVVTTSTDYTASANNEVIAVNTGSGNVEITLPAATGNESLRKIIYKTAAANTVTITPDGAETINGAASYTITTQYDFVELISDGTNWLIINSNIVTGGTVTTSSSDTLSNKSLVDSSTYIVDNADGTKKLQFQCSGITTSTTRTLTVPNFDGTIATVAGTETLTNKTLTTPTLTTPTVNTSLIMGGSAITRSAENDNINITAGATAGTNAYIIIYGHSHATYPDDVYIFGDVNIEVQAWQSLSGVLEDHWTAGDSVSYMKDPFGFVHLRGNLTAEAGAGTTVLTMPANYRPEEGAYLPNAWYFTEEKCQQILINTDGVLSIGDASEGNMVLLDGITYKAA